MNLFLAVAIPSDTQSQITEALSSLQLDYPTMSWVSAQEYKIVLGTLGDVPVDKYKIVVEHIGMLLFDIECTRIYPFDLHLSVDREAVLTLRMRENKIVREIHERIAVFCGTPVARKKEKYIASFVLARGRVGAKQQNSHMRNKLAKIPLPFYVDLSEVTLYQSIPGGRSSDGQKKHAYTLLTD